MKLILLSDIHGSLHKCREAVKLANKNKASIIIAGDLMNWEIKTAERNFLEQLKILSKCKKRVYIIPGSHEDGRLYATIGSHKKSKWDNLIDINRRIIDLKNYYLIGYGGSSAIEEKVFHKAHYGNYYKMDELMLDRLLSIKGKPVIFVSHDPPLSYLDFAVYKEVKLKNKKLLGRTPAKRGIKGAIEESVGSKILKKTVEKYKPVLCLFGHIHESAGFTELKTHKKKIKSKNLLVNPGIENIYLVELKRKNAEILKIIRV